MRLLIDGTPLSAGGGIQVAIAFLEGMRRTEPCTWLAVFPSSLEPVLPGSLSTDRRVQFVRKQHFVDRISVGRQLRVLESGLRPDVTFTIFGPAYFSPRSRHLVGFALPHLIYPHPVELPRHTRTSALVDSWRRAQFRRADHIVVETETVRKRLARAIDVGAEKISVVGNAVNPFLMSGKLDPAVSNGVYKIFVPSAYYPHKNLEFVPEVARSLRHLAPELRFCFQLTLNDQSSGWRTIAQKATKLGVATEVSTVGILPIEALASVYSGASLVFLPTLREASTSVYPEAFYFRRPLVTSNLDFAHELCGDAAVYVAPDDPRQSAESLLKVISDESFRRSLVDRGIRQLASYLSPEAKFRKQIEVIQRVAK
jgi:glycosyltransferase involved in cell wall biosynthesis